MPYSLSLWGDEVDFIQNAEKSPSNKESKCANQNVLFMHTSSEGFMEGVSKSCLEQWKKSFW